MDHRSELFGVVRRVRNRWRLRLALRGALVVAAGTITALLLSASTLETLRFTAPAIITFRIVSITVFVSLLLYGFVWPLRRRVTDHQVAMYLEERDPTLEAAIMTAVEATADGGSPDHSPHLVEKLVEQAIERCRDLEHGDVVERAAVRRHASAIAAVATITALIIALGPPYLRHGLTALLRVSSSAEAASPYRIEVTPGSAKVPRGADQSVRAKLVGFTASDAAVLMRPPASSQYERVPLIASSDPNTFEGMLFHLDKPLEYVVESNGVRSPHFTLTVVDLPTVQQLDLEYRFPAYTMLPPRKIENAGDVAAIRGTGVFLHITPTMKTPGGRIVLNDGTSAPLTAGTDGSLTGDFTIKGQGFYKIELTGPHGEKVDASPQYTIDVIDDQLPNVRFTKPGRDSQATPVEELFLEARADDDFGVKSMQLFYSVNGGKEKSVNLFSGKPMPEVSGTHTIYLEELGLNPGDFVSYYAKATDTDTVAGPKTATSDIYFVQIRPFKMDYRAAQSQAMAGGGMGGGQQQVGQLSQQQREIVAATFNIVRDKAKTKPEKYRENVVFMNLAQAKLREQVEELVQKLTARLGSVDPSFNKIAQTLPKAVEEMKAAEADLKGLKADEALQPEQRALKLLQDAEQEYEVQVAMQQGGGGGGGGQGQMAQDLADLFELELDKLANQYEMQQRAEQQQSDQQVDQLVDKLKELARRQQQELERQRRALQAGQQSGSGGSSAQRELADELEKAARQLQQLTRDQQRPEVRDAIKQLQDAADAARRAAANGSRDGGAQANEALNRLREAQQRLERNQDGRGERDLQRVQKDAEALAAEQKEVASDVNSLDQAAAGKDAKSQALAARKDQMDAKVADLQNQLEKLANQMRRDEKDAARKLDEAAGTIRDKRIREMIRYSRSALNSSQGQYARALEETLSNNLDALSKKINEAAGAMGQKAKQDSLSRAADKARDITRGLESLDQRMRDQARQQQGSRGSEGSRGSRGSQDTKGSQDSKGSPSGSQAGGQQGGQQNGQANANGSQANAGANNGGAYGGGGYWGGDARNWGGYYGGWRWDPNDIRQFRRDFREWANDAEALRRELQRAGVNPRDLDDIIKDLTRFDNDRLYADPNGLSQLQAQLLDKMKKFEFTLRRKTEGGNESLSLSGSDQVPEGFRQAIEEYYRSLAKRPAAQPQR